MRQRIKDQAADHAKFFTLVKQLQGEERLALLSACAVPKMTFISRVHRDDLCMDGVRDFEGMLSAAIEHLAEVTLDADSRALAGLPIALGGLGMRDPTTIARIAYAASKSGKRGAQQVETAAIDLATQKRLQESGKLRIEAAQADCGAAMRPPHVNELGAHPLPSAVMSAFLRLRLGRPHKLMGLSANCDGCSALFDDVAKWQNHVVGCAQRTAPNSSTTHTLLKQHTNAFIRDHGMPVEAREPSDYASVACKGCYSQVVAAAWRQHVAECPGAAKGHTRGTDLRFHLPSGAHVVDFSSITDGCASYVGKSLAEMDTMRTATKQRLYAEQAVAQGEHLHVAVVFPGGFIGKGTASMCRAIASGSAGATTQRAAQRVVRRAAALGAGLALLAAERRCGVKHDTTEAEEDAAPNTTGHDHTWQPRDLATPIGVFERITQRPPLRAPLSSLALNGDSSANRNNFCGGSSAMCAPTTTTTTTPWKVGRLPGPLPILALNDDSSANRNNFCGGSSAMCAPTTTTTPTPKKVGRPLGAKDQSPRATPTRRQPRKKFPFPRGVTVLS